MTDNNSKELELRAKTIRQNLFAGTVTKDAGIIEAIEARQLLMKLLQSAGVKPTPALNRALMLYTQAVVESLVDDVRSIGGAIALREFMIMTDGRVAQFCLERAQAEAAAESGDDNGSIEPESVDGDESGDDASGLLAETPQAGTNPDPMYA